MHYAFTFSHQILFKSHNSDKYIFQDRIIIFIHEFLMHSNIVYYKRVSFADSSIMIS